MQSQRPHQPFHGAAGNAVPFPAQLLPHLAGAIDLEMLRKYAANLWLQGYVAPRPYRKKRWSSPFGHMPAIATWGNRQYPAERLAMIVNEAGPAFYRRLISGVTKHAPAWRS